MVSIKYWNYVTIYLLINKKYKATYKSDRFLNMIRHEFGHVWGLHDAYKKDDLDDWPGAKVTDKIKRNNIMKSNIEVQSNDIEMMLQAWKENQWQYHFDSGSHSKSVVIRLD